MLESSFHRALILQTLTAIEIRIAIRSFVQTLPDLMLWPRPEEAVNRRHLRHNPSNNETPDACPTTIKKALAG